MKAVSGSAAWLVIPVARWVMGWTLLLIAVLFRTIEAFKSFDLVMGMTGGGPGDATELVAVNLYRMAFQGQWRTGQASALAYIVLIVIIAISNVYIRNLNKIREG